MNTIGPEELRVLSLVTAEITAPPVPFSGDVLRLREGTHLLVFTPNMPELSLVGMRQFFGVDPTSEPCMYNQDWYLNESFANAPPDGRWHLVRKTVLEDARGRQPGDIEASIKGERFPSAVTAALTFFAWYLLQGEALWKHDFLWCSDVDHNGDRIYVGRYEDPEGINKNGFNIHRHLSLRSVHSVAPEHLP